MITTIKLPTETINKVAAVFGVSPEEYARCASYLDFSEIAHGYYQSPESATDEMIPAFDGTGVK